MFLVFTILAAKLTFTSSNTFQFLKVYQDAGVHTLGRCFSVDNFPVDNFLVDIFPVGIFQIKREISRRSGVPVEQQNLFRGSGPGTRQGPSVRGQPQLSVRDHGERGNYFRAHARRSVLLGLFLRPFTVC